MEYTHVILKKPLMRKKSGQRFKIIDHDKDSVHVCISGKKLNKTWIEFHLKQKNIKLVVANAKHQQG